MEAGAKILIEGNVFQDCKAPVSAATLKLTSGLFNVPTAGDAASCSAALGRDCQINSLSGSGDFGSFTDTAAVEAIGSADSVWKATSAGDVTALKTSAGVGKLSSSAASSSSTSGSAAVVEAEVVSSALPSSASSSSVSPSSAPSSTKESSSATPTTFITASASSTKASATASNTIPKDSAEESDCSVAYVTVSSVTAAKETSVTAASASVVARYGRCGGNGYTGATACAEGSSCTVVNDCE